MSATKISRAVKELRIHLCQKGSSSQGVRDFVENLYVPLKKSNPELPILIRECKGVRPRLWARYDAGKESCVSLEGLQKEEVMKKVEELSKKC